MSTPIILTQPVEELPVSAKLSGFMQQHQLPSLQALLEYRSHELLKMKGFSYHCLVELYRLLREHRCEDHLREE